ncbi:MAG: aldehyde dehydrogenase family protein [Defluviitaleaceae bacterium]|nr:aldehyde dehydrogenase family protein [Defluviitaleaceae bacterium]MCL2836391.1 aldehyde dehydrogenase family protein [Defluviitaleaceae bacterium]
MATVSEMFERARIAQAEFELRADQSLTDAAVRRIGRVVYDLAEELARMAVDESGIGVYEDKVVKNRGKSKSIWNSLKGKKSYGIIEENKETGIIKIAKPMGVVGAVTPITNPIVTPMCNAMFALKGKNAIIIAPHPKVKNVNKYLVGLFRKELESLGLPGDLIQTVESPTMDDTNMVMRLADVVVATGGGAMVKAAYSSGKPALGVGPGNVQVIFDRGIDYNEAAKKVIAGRVFDNGIICTGEQCAIIPADDYDRAIEAFRASGAYYIDDPADVDKFAKALFSEDSFNRAAVGQGVQKLGELAGVSVPDRTKMILLKARGVGTADILCKEKMCPVMIALPYGTFDEAIRIAHDNLLVEGIGHSCSIHSNNMDNIRKAGEKLPISRLTVNQPSSTSTGGSLYNGFAPTTTLGCGSWGNNSISENLDYKHLINISQIGLFNKDAKIPTDEEIWGE